jgi:hypothetical protein
MRLSERQWGLNENLKRRLISIPRDESWKGRKKGTY